MGEHNAGTRRQVSLDAQLRDCLTQRCGLRPDQTVKEADTSDTRYKLGQCYHLGVCICQNKDIGHCFDNLKVFLKHVFWRKNADKKKNKKATMSDARKLLEAGLIILKFSGRTCRNEQLASSAALAEHSDEWDDMIAEYSQVEIVDTTVYGHVGKMNFSTWQFGVLCMKESDQFFAGTLATDVLLLEPFSFHDIGVSLGVNAILEVLANSLDLQHPVTISVWTISTNDADWSVVPDATIPVHRVSGTTDFTVWRGSDHEAHARRLKARAMAAAIARKSNKQRKQRKNARKPAGDQKKVRVAKQCLKLTDAQRVALLRKKRERSMNPNLDPYNDVEEPDPDSDPLQLSADGDVFSDGSFDINEIETELAALQEEESSSPSDTDADIDQNGSPIHQADSESEQLELEQSNQQNDLQDAPMENHQLQPELEAAQPEEADHHELLPEPPPEPPRAFRARARGGVRDVHNREIFDMEDIGQLRYYPSLEVITAFCPLRSTLHSPDCRIQRTVRPKKRGAGRPIGFLVGWLQKADDYSSAWSHIHGCKPSFEERKQARELFDSLPDSEDFSTFEMPPPEGEEPEPLRA